MKLLCALLVLLGLGAGAVTPAEHERERARVLAMERSISVGGSLELSPLEEAINTKLMVAKNEEVGAGFHNVSVFSPAHHFFERKREIAASPVFQFIRRMPKGAALHVHDTALIGGDFLVNLTYRSGLYACETPDNLQLVFAASPPTVGANCSWRLMSQVRASAPDVAAFDAQLARRFTLEIDNPREVYTDINLTWMRFSQIFGTVTPMLTYRPVWEDYMYEALRQYREDGLMYVEIRSTLPTLYELNGTTHDSAACARVLRQVSDRFRADFPDSFGARLIYAPVRSVDPATVARYVVIARQLKLELGDFMAGFDLVGQEDLGRPLEDFLPELLPLSDEMSVFYHAGETNWLGTTSDYNLVDAVLLGAKRLGHAYALLKHPVVADMVRANDIAVEVNPLSNQVLMLVQDLRNHPAAIMLAQGFPMIISSDDPGLWGALPMSHDLYAAFVGLASRHSDLRMLKQLALNTLSYSAMPALERQDALSAFERRWRDFMASESAFAPPAVLTT